MSDTVSDEIYEGKLTEAYRMMAAEEAAQCDAGEWIEGLIGETCLMKTSMTGPAIQRAGS